MTNQARVYKKKPSFRVIKMRKEFWQTDLKRFRIFDLALLYVFKYKWVRFYFWLNRNVFLHIYHIFVRLSLSRPVFLYEFRFDFFFFRNSCICETNSQLTPIPGENKTRQRNREPTMKTNHRKKTRIRKREICEEKHHTHTHTHNVENEI